MYDDKFPKTNDKYVGIEIECFASNDDYKVEQAFRDYDLEECVEIAYDSSIDADDFFASPEIEERYERAMYLGDYSIVGELKSRGLVVERKEYEFKVLAKQSELKDVLARMGRALKEIKADVNDSCGLHVHLDMRNRKVLDSVNKLLNVQPLMLKAVPKSRRNNTYCMPVTPKSIVDGYRIDKYHVINTAPLEDLNTIEVRVHEGTVNTEEIYKWCKFLIQTVDGSFASKPTRTTTNLPIRLKKYLNERIRAC